VRARRPAGRQCRQAGRQAGSQARPTDDDSAAGAREARAGIHPRSTVASEALQRRRRRPAWGGGGGLTAPTSPMKEPNPRGPMSKRALSEGMKATLYLCTGAPPPTTMADHIGSQQRRTSPRSARVLLRGRATRRPSCSTHSSFQADHIRAPCEGSACREGGRWWRREVHVEATRCCTSHS
jgi:hypothetical protein